MSLPMSSSPGSISVLIAEDHFVTRVGIKALLAAESDIDVVAETASGADAVTQYRALRPDVAIVDLRLPDMNGVEVTKAICDLDAHARVLILTGTDSSETVYRALQAGARAYLLKDSKGSAVVQAVRDVHAGKRVVPPEIAQRLAERLPQSDLSPRELEVLRHLAGGKSNKRIADALGIAEGTIRTHVSNILAKLGADDRTHAATEALRRGIL